MLNPINDHLMLNHKTLYSDLMSGMTVHRVITLSVGSYLYRFASGKDPMDTQISSPWWFTEAEYLKLQNYFRLNPQNIGFIARTQGAVKYGWSDMDMLVKARIIYPINGFVGPGNWVLERTAANSTITFQPPTDLFQLYLPNIREPQVKQLSAEGKKAIQFCQATPISSGDAIDKTIQNMPKKTIIIPGNPQLH